MTTRWRVGLVGAGVMGRRRALTVAAHPRCRLGVIVDHSVERAAALAADVGAGSVAGDDIDLLAACDIVVVATSTPSHHAVATPLVAAGVPVLVEKPVAATTGELDELMEHARRSGGVVAAGFQQRHHPAWTAALELIDSLDEPIVEWHAARTSPRVPRAQGSAVLDLMVHDLDLFDQWRPIGDDDLDVVHRGLFARAIGTVDDVGVRFLADRDAASVIRRIDVRTAGTHLAVDLAASTVDVVDRRGERSLAVGRDTDALAAQWQWFLDLVDGRHDVTAELDSIERVHRAAFRIDAAHEAVA